MPHEHAAHMSAPPMPMTFALEIREHMDRILEVQEGIRFPLWLFTPAVVDRRDQGSLSPIEQERFLCAYEVLNQNGTLGQLVDIHGDMSHRMHSHDRFLPWHRVYLRQLEIALEAIHPDVTLPYWDWTTSSEQVIPVWLQTVAPTVVTPTQTIHVSRSAGSSQQLQDIAANVPTVMATTDYPTFRWDLEVLVHNGVHVWVGGTMGSIPTAPADPLFWMHHANVDRLWWLWQQSSQGQGKNPPLSGADAVMDPWPTTEPDTRDIAAMGFTYV
jgi:tyrosinase